jgi:adenylosuccinate synthase
MSALNLPEINTTIAVFKSIKSKVWGWFFPTKFEDEEFANNYRNKSWEYWATTKRPRDVWYIDTVEWRKVLRTNKTNIIIFTKVDLLPELWKNAKVGLRYIDKTKWKIYINEVPTQMEDYSNLKVKYSPNFDLSQNIIWMKTLDELPQEYKKYINYLSSKLEFKGNILLGTWPCPDDFIIYR